MNTEESFNTEQPIINYKDGEYVLNPFLEIDFISQIRGMGKMRTKFDLLKSPQFLDLLFKWIESLLKPENNIDRNFLDSIFNSGIIVNKSSLPNNIYFKCKLKEKDFFPMYHSNDVLNRNQYKLNNQIYFQNDHSVPEIVKKVHPHMLDYYVNCYSKDLPIIWVQSFKNKMFMPFWPESYEKDIILNLIEGKVSYDQISKDFFEALVKAEIFIKTDDDKNDFVQEKNNLEKESYVILRNILNSVQISALRAYYRTLKQKGYFTSGDSQVRKRDSMAYEPVSHYILLQFVDLISKITGQNLRISYSIVTNYHSEAELPRHIDRDACLWNVSLVFDMEPELETKDAWPIYLDVNNDIKEIKLGIGDAVLYSGTKTPHWRNKLPENQTCSVIFLHFIEKN